MRKHFKKSIDYYELDISINSMLFNLKIILVRNIILVLIN